MASGKSQWCFQTAVTVQLPKEQGGLEGSCMYIDSENSFRPERVIQVAKKFGLDPDAVLKNIYVARAYNAEHQMILADKAAEMIQEAIKEVRSWYPEDIFIPGGESLTAKSADMARKTCDNILAQFTSKHADKLKGGKDA